MICAFFAKATTKVIKSLYKNYLQIMFCIKRKQLTPVDSVQARVKPWILNADFQDWLPNFDYWYK